MDLKDITPGLYEATPRGGQSPLVVEVLAVDLATSSLFCKWPNTTKPTVSDGEHWAPRMRPYRKPPTIHRPYVVICPTVNRGQNIVTRYAEMDAAREGAKRAVGLPSFPRLFIAELVFKEWV